MLRLLSHLLRLRSLSGRGKSLAHECREARRPWTFKSSFAWSLCERAS
jgi:hypothetical protein